MSWPKSCCRYVSGALYHLDELGDSAQAVGVGELLVADFERLLGANHPDTLGARNNLAAAYQAADVILLFERTLAARERLLGVNHAVTLGSGDNLAKAYQEAGRSGQAIPLFEQILAARKRVLGPGHPDTAVTRNSLSLAYQKADRAEEPAGEVGESATTRPEPVVSGESAVLDDCQPVTEVNGDGDTDSDRSGGSEPVES